MRRRSIKKNLNQKNYVMGMKYKTELYFLIFVSCVPGLVYCQNGQSPCPDVFTYRSEGGKTYGWIEFYSTTSVKEIALLAEFTVDTKLKTSFIGHIEPVGSEQQLLKKIENGETISYKVHLPVDSPLPRLNKITVNGNVLCQGPTDSPAYGHYVTTIQLKHTLYINRNSVVRPTEFDKVTNFRGTLPDDFDNILSNIAGINLRDNGNSDWNLGKDAFTTNFSTLFLSSYDPQNQVYQTYPNIKSTQYQSTQTQRQPTEPIQRNPVYQTYSYVQPLEPQPTQEQLQLIEPNRIHQTRPKVQSLQPQPIQEELQPIQQNPVSQTNPNFRPLQLQPIKEEPQPIQQPKVYQNYPNAQSSQPTSEEPEPKTQNRVSQTYPSVRPLQPQPTQDKPQPVQQKSVSPTLPNAQTTQPRSGESEPEPIPPAQPIPRRPPTKSPLTKLPSSEIHCGSVAGGNERVPLSFNGQPIKHGDWPWLAAIYKKTDSSLVFICAGTLISDRHVITAAHCMRRKSSTIPTSAIVVKLGVYDLQDWGDNIAVTYTITDANIHESYDPGNLANDILIITLHKAVNFNNYIRPVCLWDGNTQLNRIVGTTGMVIGWGVSKLGSGQYTDPRMVRMPVVSTEVCRRTRSEFLKVTSYHTLCAGNRNGPGPCLGDSGGGLYIQEEGNWRLRGIVSLALLSDKGDRCNLEEYVVFTDSAQYLPWIHNIISGL